MMELSRLIKDLDILELTGKADPVINAICFDSRKVREGDLFVAVRGTRVDGHSYIASALESGAAAIVCEEAGVAEGVPVVLVKDARLALSALAACFYGHPSRELSLVGVTGTNGKTTIATLLHQLHELLGYRSGLLSTIRVLIGDRELPSTHTTPDALQLQALIREMVDAGCEYVFMEVSSHAIDQERTRDLQFSGAVFSNLSRDHLDYHGDFRSYLNVKKRLFDQLPEGAFALVNIDDRNGPVMLQNCRASRHSYSLRSQADFRAKVLELHSEGSSLEVDGQELWIRLPGSYNAYNLLATYGAAVLLGHHREEILETLSRLTPVSGRFETIRGSEGTLAVVDYAHTPDALQNVLDSINDLHREGEIITVVGAGGNRDRGKRPQMARIAAEASHKLILTSDNPRDEDPEVILDEMMEGVPASRMDQVMRITSRQEAIRTACIIAGPKDLVLVAGKGHEKTQEIKGEKFPFDDVALLNQFLKAGA